MPDLKLSEALQLAIKAHKVGKVQEANRYYTAVLNAQPKHPDANHNMGVLAVGVGKVEDALPFFKTALEANPNIAQFWLSYIDALIKLDRMTDAKAIFEQAKKNGINGAKGDSFNQIEIKLSNASIKVMDQVEKNIPTQPSILDELKLDKALKLANKKVKAGFSEDAKKIYQDILKKFPKNKKALEGIKILDSRSLTKTSDFREPTRDQLQSLLNLYNEGQYQTALYQASELVKQFPNSVNLYNIMGVTHKIIGNLDDAIKAFSKVISFEPDFAEAYSNMGVIHQEKGEFEEALDVLSKAISINPKYADAYFNMGVTLQHQGRLEQAIEAYGKVTSIKSDYTEAHYNIGITFQKQGKLEKAIEAYTKAISINPKYADAYFNMGVTLQHQGRLEQAIEAYAKVISISPDRGEAYNNLGAALKKQGKLEKAIEAYTKAVSINPDHAEAYNNIGNALDDQGRPEEAITAYTKAISIKPDYADAYYNLGYALRGITFNKPNRDLQKTILSILNKESFIRPKDVALAAISLLTLEPNLQKNLQLVNTELINEPLKVISDLSEFPLLLHLMSVCPLPNVEFEKLLTNLRCSILSNISSLREPSLGLVSFQSALALQCFTNEYIYSYSKEEEKLIHLLETGIRKDLESNEQPNPQSILALASYRALNKYDWCNLLVVTDYIKDVFERQVEEPSQEKKLREDIPVLEETTNSVSSKVRDQYEESPYPRWVNLSLPFKPKSISNNINEIKLKIHDNNILKVEKPDILIAGCGTGQHSIETARRFKSSNILAVDLSLSSLAYAKRKTYELGIANIKYMQADILDLAKLNKKFDIIESSGVLHHMESPMAGWRVLKDCLKPGGLMKIGLYSELARKNIVKIRQEICELGISSSDAGMKSFRNTIIKSNKAYHKTLINSGDFYSLSTLKDMLFHVQEHRFTIPLIKDHLEKLGLSFCGFEGDKIVSHFTQTNTKKGDHYDLDRWQAYEKTNPRAFASMYQFWCQKVV